MRKMEKEKVCEKMEKELSALMDETKLTPNALENASKMVDVIKDIKNMEYWDTKCEYYKAVLDSMRGGEYGHKMEGEYSRESNGENYSRDDYDNGNSYRRGRNQNNGQYMHRSDHSRLSGDKDDMERYREMKKQYSNARDGESKGKMLDALEDFMCGVKTMLKQIYRDSDVAEERQIIRKYAQEITEM